jgi:hypothetical protein
MEVIAPGNQVPEDVVKELISQTEDWNPHKLLPYVLDDINLIRQAVGIGEGKLPELPKGVRSKDEQCVLARALSNGWRATVGVHWTELRHGDGIFTDEEGIDMEKIVESLQGLGFKAFNRSYSRGELLLERWIELSNTWAMQKLVNLFDDGHFPELFENADWPELPKGQVGHPDGQEVYGI